MHTRPRTPSRPPSWSCVRRAGSLRVREPGSLGPWLHGVAYRIALKARQGIARRRARERRAAMPAVGRPSAALEQGELHALLHEEVNRLPAKYRAPVVLCYFEGRTHDEAAAALQWPVGTVRGRLARARDLLRARLTRRGLAPSGWVGATLLEPIARLEPPTRLLEATVAAAIKGMPATAVGAMARRMLRGLLLARLGMTAGVLAMALMMAGFGLALRGAPASQARQRSETTPRADTTARIVSRPIDRRADPLPEHARLRIGGTRFNHGDFDPPGPVHSRRQVPGRDRRHRRRARLGRSHRTDGSSDRRSPDRVPRHRALARRPDPGDAGRARRAPPLGPGFGTRTPPLA